MQQKQKKGKVVKIFIRNHCLLLVSFEMWYGKTRITSYKLQVASYELKA